VIFEVKRGLALKMENTLSEVFLAKIDSDL
jgi:hypothetical protein